MSADLMSYKVKLVMLVIRHNNKSSVVKQNSHFLMKSSKTNWSLIDFAIAAQHFIAGDDEHMPLGPMEDSLHKHSAAIF